MSRTTRPELSTVIRTATLTCPRMVLRELAETLGISSCTAAFALPDERVAAAADDCRRDGAGVLRAAVLGGVEAAAARCGLLAGDGGLAGGGGLAEGSTLAGAAGRVAFVSDAGGASARVAGASGAAACVSPPVVEAVGSEAAVGGGAEGPLSSFIPPQTASPTTTTATNAGTNTPRFDSSSYFENVRASARMGGGSAICRGGCGSGWITACGCTIAGCG